jgi:predicted dehydrogenase
MLIATTVVGCGAVAQRLYQDPLRRLERQGVLRVIALVDRHRPHAETLRASFPRAAVYEDLEPALNGQTSELTLVLSPVQCHPEHTILALEHDNHVLCEKPMAATEAHCDQMIAATRRKDRVLAVGMIRRFFPAFAQFKELLARHELGDLCSFTYREGKLFDWDVKTPAGFLRSRGGGSGLLFDIGPHVLDALTWFFGPPRILSYADDALGGTESNFIMVLETPACRGSVQVSWDSPLKNELRVIGSKGEAVLRVDQSDRLAVRRGDKFEEVPIDYSYPTDTARTSRRSLSPRFYTQSLYCQLIQVARAIRLGEPPAVGGVEGKECVRLLQSASHQARPLEMPWLDSSQREAYETLHRASRTWDRSQSSERVAS